MSATAALGQTSSLLICLYYSRSLAQSITIVVNHPIYDLFSKDLNRVLVISVQLKLLNLVSPQLSGDALNICLGIFIAAARGVYHPAAIEAIDQKPRRAGLN